MNSQLQAASFLKFSFERRKDTFFIPERVLSYMDLTYCLEGSMEYLYEGEKIILRAGDAILYPPGTLRQRNFTTVPNYIASFNIQFPFAFETPVCGHLKNCIHSNTLYLLETFYKDFNSVSPYKQEKCVSTFSYLYYQLLETVLDTENPHVKNTKQYIIEHLTEPLDLGTIAAHVHLERHYLCALFKQHTNMTIVEYIIEQRIDLAKRLIITQDAPLCIIAEHCGFTDYNYFSKTFKKHTGTTAIKYRKMKQKIN